MGTSGQLKTKVDRLKKKLAAKGASLDAGKRRVLHKKLKRFQRARRTAAGLEKRAAGMAGAGKPAGKAAEDKPSGTTPETATPAG